MLISLCLVEFSRLVIHDAASEQLFHCDLKVLQGLEAWGHPVPVTVTPGSAHLLVALSLT